MVIFFLSLSLHLFVFFISFPVFIPLHSYSNPYFGHFLFIYALFYRTFRVYPLLSLHLFVSFICFSIFIPLHSRQRLILLISVHLCIVLPHLSGLSVCSPSTLSSLKLVNLVSSFLPSRVCLLVCPQRRGVQKWSRIKENLPHLPHNTHRTTCSLQTLTHTHAEQPISLGR